MEATIEALSVIEKTICLKGNYDKTKLYCIGSLANSNAKICMTKEFSWTNDSVDILGVTIGNQIQTITEANFKLVLNKIHNILHAWYF